MKITAAQWEPQGTFLTFEAQRGGLWYQLSEGEYDALSGNPTLVPLRMVFNGTRDLMPGIDMNQTEVEIGVGYDSSVRGSLMYEPLLVERQQLYCSRSSPYFGHRVSRLGELKDQDFVLTGEDEIEAITHIRRRYRLGSRVSGLAEDINEARRLIVQGVGIGFLPIYAAASEVASGKLWPMLHADFEPAYDIFLLARYQQARDTATQLFWDEVVRRIRAQSRP